MRDEAIREFRRSWKPKVPGRAERTRRAPLALVPSAIESAPRVSHACPLPPPAAAALRALPAPSRSFPGHGTGVFPGSGTGVRRRPEPKSELERLSLLVEANKPRKSTSHCAPPPPPPVRMRNAVLPGLAPSPSAPAARDRKRNAREPTDPHIEILTSYVVPPVPGAAGRHAVISVESDWFEVVHDVLATEARPEPVEQVQQPRSLLRRWVRGLMLVASLICFVELSGVATGAEPEPIDRTSLRE